MIETRRVQIDPRPPIVTYLLLAAIAAVFVLQQVDLATMMVYGALWPYGGVVTDAGYTIPFAWWQLVTYSFLHGDLTHLVFNGLGVFTFGRAIEQTFGRRRFVLYWFACVIGAAIAQLVVQAIEGGPGVPTVGASGGVFGLLFAFGVLFPKARLMLIFPPIPMPAWLFVILYGLVELYLGVSGKQAQVAHFAHLGGMVAGIPMVLYWRRQLLAGKRLWLE